MTNIEKEIISVLQKIRLRLFIKKLIDNILVALLLALSLGSIVLIVSRFIPIYNNLLYSFFVILIFILSGAFFSIIKAPKIIDAAKVADSFGMSERAVTAYELIGKDAEFLRLQKEDARLHLISLDFRNKIQLFKFDMKWIFNIAFLIIFIVLIMTPNQLEEIAKSNHEISKEIRLQKEKINTAIKKVEKESLLDNDKKEELLTILKDLDNSVKAAKNENDIEKSLQKADKKLDLMQNTLKDEEIKKAIEELEKNKYTKPISDNLKNITQKDLDDNIKEFNKTIETMSEKERLELIKSLDKLSDKLFKSDELKDSLSKISDKLKSNESMNMEKEMQSLQKSLESMISDDRLRQVSKDIKSQLQNNNQNCAEGNCNNNIGSNADKKEGVGNKSGNGSDIGEGTNVVKKDSSNKKTADYEKVFSSNLLDTGGNIEELKGMKNDSGESDIVRSEEIDEVLGESVTYDKVIAQYENRAMETIESYEIPIYYRELVKEYFKSLSD